MNEKLKQVEQILAKYGQTQLLKGYERLTDETEKQKYLDNILTIDFNQVKELYEKSQEKPSFLDSKIEPIDFVDKAKLSEEEYRRYEKIGIAKIKEGKLAVVLMAGGQGTRLGHSGPKGTFDLGLDSHKSIFEILSDTMNEARNKYEAIIPWYIMTSEENDEETKKFFKKHNFFGYPENLITFFKQGKLPMVDTQGKILIGEDGRIKEAADGHGGIFCSLLKEGMTFADAQSKHGRTVYNNTRRIYEQVFWHRWISR